VTDSRAPGEPKEVAGSALFQIYQAFASDEETAGMRQAYADGIGWGEAKQRLFERVDAEVAPLRTRYEALIARPDRIEGIVREGALRLRERHAAPFLARLRHAVGLRDLSEAAATIAVGDGADATARPVAPPAFKQYRDPDGRFYFKLQEGD